MANMTQRRCASVAALMTIKDITREDAEKIRQAWRSITNREEARQTIDKMLKTYGVEYLGRHKRTGHHVYYCNAGDSYVTTVTFHGPVMRVACWADYVEKNLIEEGASW